MWDPTQYARYGNERSRPFLDLLARVPLTAPATVVDLGCGDGSPAAILAERWPGADIVGVDSSAEMLAVAATHAGPRTSFRLGTIQDWRPDAPVDLLISNAALQWVPDHADLFGRFVAALAPGGVFAYQVPGNFDAPSHTLLRDLCATPRWRDRLGADLRLSTVPDPAEAVDRLATLGCVVDAWETTYLHVLDGADPVLNWTRGTALRPVLAVLDEGERAAFEAEYAALLREAYPTRPYGTPFPFRRLFAVARRG